MEDDGTTRTAWDQTEDPVLDSVVLGVMALGIAGLSAVCSLSYFFTPLTYLGAVVALVLGLLARGVPRSRGLGTVAVALAIVACVAATAVLITVDG